MHLSISEILNLADDAPLLEDKVFVLRNNYSKQLVHILQAAFDDRIKFLLPEGPVPYKPTRAIGQEGNLYQEARRMYLFVKGGHPTLSQRRREDLFVQLLENIDHRDADLLVHVKDKKLPYPTITYEVFKAAFPDVDCVHDPKKPKEPNEVPVTVKPVIPTNIEWGDVPPAAILFGEDETKAEQQAVENIIDDAANAILAETEPPKKKRGRPKGTTTKKKTKAAQTTNA